MKTESTVWSYSFSQKQQLGKGSFSEVYQGHRRCKLSGKIEPIAVKRCKVPDIESKRHKALENEIGILKELSNQPHIVQLYTTFVHDNQAHMCFELCHGGDLLGFIRKQPMPMSETIIRIAGRQLGGAVEFLHQRNIIHRDIKPQNVLLVPTDQAPGFGYIAKLSDFGLATRGSAELGASSTDSMYQGVNQTWCGTPNFMSPEMLFRMRYDKTVDLYAYGAVLYQMRTRTTPVRGKSIEELRMKINKRRLLWPPGTSMQLRDLCEAMLDTDPTKRIAEITQHSFFVDNSVDLSMALKEYVLIDNGESSDLETRLQLLKATGVSEDIIKRGMTHTLTDDDRDVLSEAFDRCDFRRHSDKAAARGQTTVARTMLQLAAAAESILTKPTCPILAIGGPDDSNHLGTLHEESKPIPIPHTRSNQPSPARFCFRCGAQFQTINAMRCRCGQLRHHMSV